MTRRLPRLPLLLLLLATCFATAAVPPREVAPTDQAKFGRLVLDNGLRVLLVSDPAFNKSAASLAGADARQRLVLLHAPAHTPSAATPTFTDRTDWKATRQYE